MHPRSRYGFLYLRAPSQMRKPRDIKRTSHSTSHPDLNSVCGRQIPKHPWQHVTGETHGTTEAKLLLFASVVLPCRHVTPDRANFPVVNSYEQPEYMNRSWGGITARMPRSLQPGNTDEYLGCRRFEKPSRLVDFRASAQDGHIAVN